MARFDGKIAIITGGASGIGRAIGEELGRRGATVVVTDINKEGAEEVASGINSAGGRAEAALLDVSKQKDVQKLIMQTADKHGRLDYIFNNAGIGILGETRDMEMDHWRQTIDVNLWGVIYGSTAAYSLMVRQGFGHIVNTASMAGLISSPIAAPYGTTKHAVVGLSTSLRAEGAGLGVKVSVVCPGVIRTPIFETSPLLNTDKDAMLERMPDWMMTDVDKAALTIIKGVIRNQAIIIPPFQARAFWWLQRLSPRIMEPIWAMFLKEFRKYRQD